MSPNYAAIPKTVINDAGITKVEAFTLAALAYYADREGVCTVTLRTLAERARTSRNHVWLHLKKLKAQGHLVEVSSAHTRGRHTFQIVQGDSSTGAVPDNKYRSGNKTGTPAVPHPHTPNKVGHRTNHRSSSTVRGGAARFGQKGKLVFDGKAKSKYARGDVD